MFSHCNVYFFCTFGRKDLSGVVKALKSVEFGLLCFETLKKPLNFAENSI